MTQRALITGATGALGGAFCRLLAEEGVDVVAVGRDEARLAALTEALPAVQAMPVDLAEPTAVDRLVAAFPHVDIVVAAAGATIAAPTVARDWAGIEREIATNASSVVALCRAYGAGMAARGQGRIVTIASTAAARPAPGLAVYGAAKAFVLAFSRSLSHELRDRGVRVTCCVPGPIRSEFAERSGLGFRPGGLDPLGVATLTLRANARGRSVVFASTGSRLRWLAFGAMPDVLASILLSRRGSSAR